MLLVMPSWLKRTASRAPTPPTIGSQPMKPGHCKVIRESNAPGARSAPGLSVPKTYPTPLITIQASRSSDVNGSKVTKLMASYWKLMRVPARPASAPEMANAVTLVRNTPTPDADAARSLERTAIICRPSRPRRRCATPIGAQHEDDEREGGVPRRLIRAADVPPEQGGSAHLDAVATSGDVEVAEDHVLRGPRRRECDHREVDTASTQGGDGEQDADGRRTDRAEDEGGHEPEARIRREL